MKKSKQDYNLKIRIKSMQSLFIFSELAFSVTNIYFSNYDCATLTLLSVKWGLKGGILIDSDFGPPRYAL